MQVFVFCVVKGCWHLLKIIYVLTILGTPGPANYGVKTYKKEKESDEYLLYSYSLFKKFDRFFQKTGRLSGGERKRRDRDERFASRPRTARRGRSVAAHAPAHHARKPTREASSHHHGRGERHTPSAKRRSKNWDERRKKGEAKEETKEGEVILNYFLAAFLGLHVRSR